MGRIQAWLAIAGGTTVAVFLAAFHLMGIGKKTAQADMYAEAEEQEDELDSYIQAGHAASSQFDSDGVFDVSTDPYNRANRRDDKE